LQVLKCWYSLIWDEYYFVIYACHGMMNACILMWLCELYVHIFEDFWVTRMMFRIGSELVWLIVIWTLF